jgi:DNA-binding transcriptional LysR family regulator
VRLVADHDFPASLLMLALRQFAHVRSGTQVCLSEVTMQQAARALSDRTADLAISTHIPPGFLGDPLMELEYVAVAHPEHGLFRLGHPITVADLTRQVKIVVGHSTDLLHGTKPSPGCLQHWNVSSVDTAMEALHACLGYAWLPRHRIRDRLSQGALQALPLVDGGVFSAIFYLVHGHDRTPDPDAKKLAQALHRAVAMDAA